MENRVVEILVIKLAQAEANAAVMQAQAESLTKTVQELQQELSQLKGVREGVNVQIDD